MDLKSLLPREARKLIREKRITGTTSGISNGYVQANLVILPKELAFDFLLFCQRNPKSCPLLDVTEIGSPTPELFAPEADLRIDIPRYRIYQNGKLTEQTIDIFKHWNDDMMAFLLGCSFSFERALLDNGIPVRHIEHGSVVPMYFTNIQCRKAGRFKGPTVVSMRPIPEKDLVHTVQITSRYSATHGAPIHIGTPESIGIKDINQPDFGNPVPIRDGEVPVFWACGVTPQSAVMEIKPELVITHEPGHMFISDYPEKQLFLQ